MVDEILHKGKFVELRVKEVGDSKYEYSHENRCDGQIVAFIPFHSEKGFLLRHEITPCWGENDKGYHINSFTGGWERDKHQTPVETVIDELREEAGILLSREDSIISLGTCHGAKSCDSVYHLFAVDLNNGYAQIEPQADSQLEAQEECCWYESTSDWIQQGADPMLYAVLARMQANNLTTKLH